MKERGSALLTSVISILVLVLVSGVLFTIALSYAKIETSEEKGIIAYHMAEAGIQYGIAEILDRDLGKDDLPTSTEINNPYGQGGEIVVEMKESDEGGSFIVTSTATYNGVTRRKEAEYLYEEEPEEEIEEEEE